MLFISQETIEKAKDADMLNVIQHYIKLKQNGPSWKGLSPFQKEKNPSFIVSPQKGIWKCFSSGEGGMGAISFVMKLERLNFFEAVEMVCNIEKIPILYDTPNNGVDKELWQKKQQRRKSAKEILEYANQYFQAGLISSKEAQEYLAARKLNPETLITFGLGYAPNAAHFVTKDLEVCESVSLLTSFNNGSEYKDFFLDRIIIPFHDKSGNVIGFAGRELHPTDAGSKYKNSRNTEAYNKDKYLYGYSIAAKALREKQKTGEDWLYIVEGYFNVMRLFEVGVPSVATGSTSLSDSQIEEIKKLTNKVVLFRDNDEAGRLATDKQIVQLLTAGFHVKVFHFALREFKNNKNPFLRFESASFAEKSDIDDISVRVYKDTLERGIEIIKDNNMSLSYSQLENWAMRKTLKLVKKGIEEFTMNWMRWLMIKRWKSIEIPAETPPEDRVTFLNKIAHYVASIPSLSTRNEWADEATTIFKKAAFKSALKEALEELKEKNSEKQYAEVEIGDDGIYVMGTKVAEFCMAVTERVDVTIQRKNGKRKFAWEVELWQPHKSKTFLTIPEEDLSTSGKFYQYIMSYGFNYNNTNENYHRYLIQHFNQELPLMQSIHYAGWNNEAGIYFYSNAAFRVQDGQILRANEKSIIMAEADRGYKLTLLSEAKAGTIQADYEQFQYHDSHYTLGAISNIIKEAWGEDALLTCCYTIASCFFDYITKIHGNFMPIFWVWSSQASSGKTKLCTLNTQFFGGGRTHDMLNDNTSIPGIVAALEGIQNTVHVLDDFKRGLKYHSQVKMLQGFAQLTGHTIFDVDTQRNITKAVRGGIFTTSNEIPTESIYNAFRTRLFVLELTQNSDRSEAQYAAYDKVVSLLETNLSSISVGIIKHRQTVIDNYLQVHRELKKYFRTEISKEYDSVEDRYYESATFVAATTIILLRNNLIQFPITEDKIKELCIEKILSQIGYERQMEPLQEFWNLMQLAHEDGNHKIKYKIEIHQEKDDSGMVVWQGIALKFRFERLYRLYNDSFKAMGSDISRKLSEFDMRRQLENADYFLGKSIATRLQKDSDEVAHEKKKSKKKIKEIGIFRAMAVDYSRLAEKYGLELIAPAELEFLQNQFRPKTKLKA